MNDRVKNLLDRLIQKQTITFEGILSDEKLMADCVKQTLISIENNSRAIMTLQKNQDYTAEDAAKLDKDVADERFTTMTDVYTKLFSNEYESVKELAELTQDEYVELKLDLMKSNSELVQKFVTVIKDLTAEDAGKIMEKVYLELNPREEISGKSCGCNIYNMDGSMGEDSLPDETKIN